MASLPLIERLQKATGPDRGLDIEVLHFMYPAISRAELRADNDLPRLTGSPEKNAVLIETLKQHAGLRG